MRFALHIRSLLNQGDEDRIREQLKAARRPADELQTLQLTLRRDEAHRHEFGVLFYSFNGARIFFKDPNANAAPTAVPAPSSST